MSAYDKRVRELEAEGLTTSDAQGAADIEAADPHRIAKQRDDLLAALKDVDLRATQAGIAWSVTKKKKQTAFLLGELERLKTVARAAIANATYHD